MGTSKVVSYFLKHHQNKKYNEKHPIKQRGTNAPIGLWSIPSRPKRM